jgi:F-type H+-transporting ATPase subunit delta
MIPANVARRYAKALSELGAEAGSLDVLVDEIGRAAKAYDESPELQRALENPLVPYATKKAILGDIAQALGLGQIAKNTVSLLADRRRLRALPAIAQRLREMNDLKKGLLRAEVLSAAPLSEEYKQKLNAQLESMTGKKIALDVRLDPSLIAGVVTRIGDTVYDGSILARLNELRHALLS